MNGPEHYAEAERLLSSAAVDLDAGHAEGNRIEHDAQVARAQVHATLALVAATANADFNGDPLADLPSAWDGDHNGDGPTWQSVTA